MNGQRKLLYVAFVFQVAMCGLCMGCGSDDCRGNKRPLKNEASVTIAQGLWGDVWFWDGDFMPICPQGIVRAVSREIVIFERATQADVTSIENRPGFYSEVRVDEIARITSNQQGFYQLTLPPGEYSIFIVEDSMYYRGAGHYYEMVSRVMIAEDVVTELRIDITYLSSS